MIVGQNIGLAEIAAAGDTIEAAAAGATGTRHPVRWDGLYGDVFQRDSRDPLAPHNVRPEYVEMIRTHLLVSKACRQTTILAMDSDQLQGKDGGRDLWTADGQRERLQLIRLGGFYAREFAGLADYMEPIVEPQGPNVTRESLWAYQEQFALWVLSKNPALKLLMGARSYFAALISEAFCPAWGEPGHPLYGKVALTCNFQSDLVCNPGQFDGRLEMVLRERDRRGVEVLVNQIWSFPGVDPDGALLAAAIRKLSREGIGSLVWTACARFDSPQSAGLRHLADPNDPGSEHIKREATWANVTAAWQEANA